ncbi:E3 ubiquitin-protein ligase TRIM21-like [Coregonus clupeaformis]|uniref:E3 ubiquitin-protein ligase TRIM21-like n=1 Tax=Coregonus clupeaformis TaxID=59861 RepID=UPI001E1C30D3|nr:E3 ubiquitin-protein ligase TRIM21-like [Coregonus clupeaformis]
MSTSSNVLSEEQFLCSICLDVFTEPVSIPCGHNFCKACISGYWNSTALCQCPLCKETFNRRPEPKTNTTLRDVADHFKRKKVTDGEESSSNPGEVAQVQKMIQERLQKVREIKYSVELSQRDAEREIAESVEVFTALVRSIERSQAELIEVVEEKQKAAERRAEGLIEELEQEITELQRRGTELDHLQNSPSPYLPTHTKDWSEISVPRDLHVGTVRRALSQLEETFLKEMEKLCNAELRSLRQWSVDVTLDLDSEHPMLIVSEDRKQVRYGNTWRNIPDNPKRFDQRLAVLGKEGFSSGRFYFEVQVRGKIEWVLGVARESIIRKGPTAKSPDGGLWALYMKGENKYEVKETPPIPLSLSQKPQKVGVFVDYEKGQISFYDVENRSHIYSFTGCTFTEKLYPYLNPCDNSEGPNTAPLVISPVNHTD